MQGFWAERYMNFANLRIVNVLKLHKLECFRTGRVASPSKWMMYPLL